MPNLIFVRHSVPHVIEGQPSHSWKLSAEGQARCLPLAEQLKPHSPQNFFSSNEPKALETGAIVAASLMKPIRIIEGLHEHVRSAVPWMGRDQFEQSVRAFFGQPDALVFGDETANQCYERFSKAVDGILAENSQQTNVIFSHGTVITLFVARRTKTDPFPLWQSLTMPWFGILTLPEYELMAQDKLR